MRGRKEISKRDQKRNANGKKRQLIFCANCYHCTVFKKAIGDGKRYVLRVRCDKGMWRKRSGEEKIYKYFTILRRVRESCEYYEPMGELEEYIKELKKSLPIYDEIYSYS